MRPATEIMTSSLILADGAMGTYYAQLAGSDAASCELANTQNPALIRQIHQEYIAAGSRLLRTNTFAAAAVFGADDPAGLTAVVRAGFEIASECAGDLAFVAADLGPVYNLEPDAGAAATKIVVDTFLELGANLFLFETFADPDDFLPFCQQIKDFNPQAIIIASFTVSADGYTRKGLSLDNLSRRMEGNPLINIWGMNCGVGPTHLIELAHHLAMGGKPLTMMPNSGYPRQENQRLLFGSTPDYFAQATARLAYGRTRLLGGCCGTTPQHIRELRVSLDQDSKEDTPPEYNRIVVSKSKVAAFGRLSDKLDHGDFVVVCELDPPRTSQMDQIIASARQLHLAGFDAITLADSPLARVKMEPIACAARISRETGMPVLPHLCCRDRNANALRSSLLAAHSEGIRQILAITGDAIPESDKGFIKPVFNFNSFGLLNLIKQMNQDEFADDTLLAAAALDAGVANPSAELERILRKKENGARLILTQPVYDTQGLELIRRVRAAGLKVLIGLMPLVSYRNARFLSEEVPGIRIPPSILERFHPDQTREQALDIGLAVSLEIAAAVRHEADGFYLIAPFNRADIMVRLREGLLREKLL